MENNKKSIKGTKKGKKKILKLRNCHIVTQDNFLTREKLESILKKVSNILGYAYILHDKDKYSIIEHEKNVIPEFKKVGDFKIPHYHIVLRLNNAYTTNLIASWFGILPNLVEKIKSSLSHTLQYLTHLNEEDRRYQHLYDDSEVVSNFAWIPLRDSQKIWSQDDLEIFLNRIDTGEVNKSNLDSFCSRANFHKYREKINNAFDYYEIKTINSGVKKEINVVYIYGTSGTLKNHLAEDLAKRKGFHKSLFIAQGSSDPFGKYGGQKAVILPDVRPKDSNLKLPDILNFLDNSNRYRYVKSRYKDKLLECSWLFITSILTVDEFFEQMIDKYGEIGKNEKSLQLHRRIKYLIHVTEDEIEYRTWLHNQKKWSNPCFKFNDLKEKNNFSVVDPNDQEVFSNLQLDFHDQEINPFVPEVQQEENLVVLAKEFFGEEKVTVLNGNISDNDF